jgi:hypothetical protein
VPNIQRISFHEDEIQVITDDRTGKEFVLPKPIVDMFGLSWQGQLAKLSKNKLFSRSIKKIFMDTDAGQREIVVLERRMADGRRRAARGHSGAAQETHPHPLAAWGHRMRPGTGVRLPPW